MKTIEDYIEEIWSNYREDLTPAEKGELTKYKNHIADVNSEVLAKLILCVLWTQDIKKLKGM